ncbi:MAG: T9SS type A sorting domain-containing protein [Saprospiraceae bacterium]
MNKLSTLSCAILGLFLLAGCFTKNTPTENKPDMEAKLNFPNEYFNLQRAYPDPYMDWKAFEKGLKQAHDMVANRDAGFDDEWTVQGPGNIGARANTVAVHPTNENIIYTGFSCGGVWKTTDGGANWLPIFDEQLWPAIGCIVIDPNNPETVYVGTGDPNISSYTYLGDGIYKSTDGGATWENIGLKDQRIISKIVLHPTDPNIIFAGSMGLPFVRGNDRGLYRSTDGGDSWQQVLFISDQAGITDLIMDPFDPNTLYASGWDRVRNNMESVITGPGAKVYKSTDGGDNWTLLENGLPSGELGRTGLAISHLTPGLVYAMYMGTDSQLAGIYKTTNGGASWEPTIIDGLENAMGGFGWYFGKMETSPYNDDELFVLGIELWKGYPEFGAWMEANPPWWTYEVHADKHDITFSSSGNIYLATDGGLYKSTDDAATWVDIENIPTTQFYRVAYNPHQPDWYYGGAQDNGTSGGNAGIINDWPRIYGGDGFQPVFHPLSPDIFFVETQNGNISMTDNGGFDFFPADNGIDADDRRNWDMPYILSPHNPDVFYAGTFRMYKSSQPGLPLFAPISSDLTDGLILNPRHHNISTLDESPKIQGLLYVGTSDGNAWVSDNDGATWTNISQGLPDRYVTSIKASPTYGDGVFVTHSGYRDNEFIPRLHRSANRGSDWEDISSNLPNVAINDVFILPGHADSVLFVATDAGVYASLTSGQEWQRLGKNMPFVPNFDLEWNPVQNTLIAGTFARSIMTYPLDSLLVAMPVDTAVAVRTLAVANSGLQIYPNPVSRQVTVACASFPNSSTEIVLLDNNGKLVHQATFEKGQAIEMQFDMAGLPAGNYMVKVKAGQAVRAGKFVKL